MASLRVFLVFLLLACAVPATVWAEARMTFVGPKSIYAKVGLQTGDIVIDVDGRAPASAGQVAALIFAALERPGTHTLQIRRRGEVLTLNFGK